MTFFLLWVLALIAITVVSAYCTVKVNQEGIKSYYAGIIATGFLMSFLWIFISKKSSNILRDSLIWDVVLVVTFSFVLVCSGCTSKYELKQWIGVGLTAGVFMYWLLIR